MNATFDHAKMVGVDMSGAVVVGASFTKANLTMSSLKGADVGGACFKGTDLSGANVDVKRIGEADFSGAIYDERTIWPIGFDPQSHGAIKV